MCYPESQQMAHYSKQRHHEHCIAHGRDSLEKLLQLGQHSAHYEQVYIYKGGNVKSNIVHNVHQNTNILFFGLAHEGHWSFLAAFRHSFTMLFFAGLISMLVLTTIRCVEKSSWQHQSASSLTDTDHGRPASQRRLRRPSPVCFRAQEVRAVSEAYVPWQQALHSRSLFLFLSASLPLSFSVTQPVGGTGDGQQDD